MRPEAYEEMFEVEDLHWWYRGLRAIVDDARRDFRLSEGNCLDAGSGTGGVLARWPTACLGLDISPDAIRFAKRRRLRNMLRAEVARIPFPNATFDTVLSLDVLYHQAVQDKEALAEMWRVLRPGGHVVINVPAYPWLFSEHDRAIHTGRRYTRRHLRASLAESGFSIRRLSHWNAALFPAAVAHRLVTRQQARSSDLANYRPGVFDDVASRLIGLERGFVRRVSIPFGLSIFAVARKD